MDKLGIRQQLIDICLAHHRRLAETAVKEMNEAWQNAREYGNPEDWADTYKTDQLNKRDIYAQYLKKANEDIKLLEKISPRVLHDEIRFGSVVITGSQKLFVATGIGKVDCWGETYFVISPSVPFFQPMRGLRKGDSFAFRGKTEKITDVF